MTIFAKKIFKYAQILLHKNYTNPKSATFWKFAQSARADFFTREQPPESATFAQNHEFWSHCLEDPSIRDPSFPPSSGGDSGREPSGDSRSLPLYPVNHNLFLGNHFGYDVFYSWNMLFFSILSSLIILFLVFQYFIQLIIFFPDWAREKLGDKGRGEEGEKGKGNGARAEQGRGRARAGDIVLDFAAQARAKLTFCLCLFFDEARDIRLSYLFMGFWKANLTKPELVKTFQCVCACMRLAFFASFRCICSCHGFVAIFCSYYSQGVAQQHPSKPFKSVWKGLHKRGVISTLASGKQGVVKGVPYCWPFQQLKKGNCKCLYNGELITTLGSENRVSYKGVPQQNPLQPNRRVC